MTPLATDWDQYYDRPAPTAHLTRRYTAHWLQTMMRRHSAGKSQLSIIEFGGGNSCFFKGLVEAHGGAVRAEAGAGGQGTAIVMLLPLAGAAAGDEDVP